jgi:flavodoxin
MGVLIIYRTRHGCAEKAAMVLKEKLNDEVVLVDLKRDSEAVDLVLRGGKVRFH